MDLDTKEAISQAKKEIEEEDFRDAVEKQKYQLRHKKSFLEKVFPWKIVITKR